MWPRRSTDAADTGENRQANGYPWTSRWIASNEKWFSAHRDTRIRYPNEQSVRQGTLTMHPRPARSIPVLQRGVRTQHRTSTTSVFSRRYDISIWP